jgi:hypothetical protein
MPAPTNSGGPTPPGRARLRLIRGGADERGAEVPADSRSSAAHKRDTAPYAELLEIAGRCSFYAALTTSVFDSIAWRASDSRFRGRRK